MALMANNITKTFNDGQECLKVLADVSITFPISGCVYLVGSSGSGKSTLLNILGGIEKIDGGRVTLNGRDLKNLPNYQRDHVAFVHQRANLVSFSSGRGNVELACHLKKVRFDRKRYNSLLARLDLDGHDLKPVSQLSFGMCQRFALIQALMTGCKIILLDEPTGSVDKTSAAIIKRTIEQCAKNHLFVIATHDRDLCKNGRVIDFDNLKSDYRFLEERYGLIKRELPEIGSFSLYPWHQFARDWKKAALIVVSQIAIATALVVMLVLFFQANAFYQESLQNSPYNRIVTIESREGPFEDATLDAIVADNSLTGHNPHVDLNSLILSYNGDYLDVGSFELNPAIDPTTITAGRLIEQKGEILVNQALLDRGVALGGVVVGAIGEAAFKVVGVVDDCFNSLPAVYYQPEFLFEGIPGDPKKANLIIDDYHEVDKIIEALSGNWYAFSDFANFKDSYATMIMLSGAVGAFFIGVSLTIGIILYSLVLGVIFLERHQDNCLMLLLGLKKRELFFNMLYENLAVAAAISLIGSVSGLACVNLVKTLAFIPEFLREPLDLAIGDFALLAATMAGIYFLVGLLAALSQLNKIRRLDIAQVLKEE